MDAFNEYMNGHIVTVNVGGGGNEWKDGAYNGVLST